MRGIEAPERLDGHVEGALRPLRKQTSVSQQLKEFERRRRKPPVPVEPADRALGPVQAEHVLQPVDLGDAARDQPARAGTVRVVQDDLGRRSQCDAGPAVQVRRLRAGPDRRERQAGRRCRNGDEAPPGRRGTGPPIH